METEDFDIVLPTQIGFAQSRHFLDNYIYVDVYLRSPDGEWVYYTREEYRVDEGASSYDSNSVLDLLGFKKKDD